MAASTLLPRILRLLQRQRTTAFRLICRHAAKYWPVLRLKRIPMVLANLDMMHHQPDLSDLSERMSHLRQLQMLPRKHRPT